MTVQTIQLLDAYGPERCETLTLEEARTWCRRLARRRKENFSVLSALVPRDRRDAFAAVYAFCRWADDLGDDMGGEAAERQRSLDLLAWWREELQRCFDGEPRHPIFIALRPVIERHGLEIDSFDDLIRAFEQDQRVTRYDTWDQLLDYCRLSANPVGRLVLGVLDEPGGAEMLRRSDAVCTALQLTNHWQDIRRDVIERDRIYIPRELIDIDDFEARLVASARQEYAVNREFLPAARTLVRGLVERTWALYEEGDPLISLVSPAARPAIWLFGAGGQRVLHLIEMWNYETVLHRPTLGRLTRATLVATALLRARAGGFGGERR